MGLPWIKVAVVLPNHPKLQRLEKCLQLEDGLGLLTRLWCWTATYYPDGMIPASATPGLERFVNAELTITYWRNELAGAGGPPRNGETLDALVECGWLDPIDANERYRVHDWHEFQSAHADKAERDKEQVRERVRRFRKRKRNASVTDSSNVTVTVTGNGVTAKKEREREKEKEIDPIPLARTPQITAGSGRAGEGNLGPLGSQFVQAVEQGLGHGLIPAKNGQAEALEASLQAWGGVDPALDFVAATCRKRDVKPQSVAWLVKVLGNEGEGTR